MVGTHKNINPSSRFRYQKKWRAEAKTGFLDRSQQLVAWHLEVHVLSGRAYIRSGLDVPRPGLHPLRIDGLLAWTSLVTVLIAAPVARAQSFLGGEATTAALSSYGTVDGLGGDDIIGRMIEGNRVRNEHLQSYSAVRTYELRDLDGQVSAQAVIRVDYRAPGTKIFQKVSEGGSWTIRHLVFDRLVQGEEETSSGQERRESAISEENYSFTIVGVTNLGSNHCYIVEAKPKRMDKYLLEGELWIDAQDFGIVRISGHPATKLSFWINRANFVREYQRIGGFWLPYRDATIVDVKVHGTKVFRIEHQQYVIHAANDLGASTVGFGPHN
jgi:hypothetical protein